MVKDGEDRRDYKTTALDNFRPNVSTCGNFTVTQLLYDDILRGLKILERDLVRVQLFNSSLQAPRYHVTPSFHPTSHPLCGSEWGVHMSAVG